MKYKSLFIDLDDTLWDTYHNNKECLEEVYVAHHFDRHYASFEAFFDIYWPHNNLLWEQYRNNEACWTKRYRAKVPTTTSGGAG